MIFKDREILKAMVPPEDMIAFRSEQIKMASLIFNNLMKGVSGSSLICYGTPGSGKTMTMLKLKQDYEFKLKQGDKIIYVNTRKHPTEMQLLSAITEKLKFPVRSRSISKYYSVLSQILKGTNCVMILDEIDVVIQRSGDHVLNNLWELRNSIKANISLIMITNDITFLDLLEARVKSRLQPFKIMFSPYNASELYELLVRRAKSAFEEEAVPDGVIRKIAAIIAQETGDAREAFSLLEKTGNLAEEQESSILSAELVDKALKFVELNEISYLIKTLPRQTKIVLRIIINLQERGSDQIFYSDVYNEYYKIYESYGVRLLTSRRIIDLLWQLAMSGVINTKYSSTRKGRTKTVLLQFPIDILDRILKSEGI